MYFWRVELLKGELRQGPVGQRAAFGYVLATLLPYTIFTDLPGLWNAEAEPVTPLDWAAYAAIILLVGVGTYAAYRANGGQTGSDFPSRYFALGWVLGVRLGVLLLVPALLLAFLALAAIAFIEPDGELSDSAIGWIATAVGVGFVAVYYWRLVRHFGQVAVSEAPRAGITCVAG
jgi:hypothetical protein